ncbi:hypothetical protein ACQ4LE_007528 [Meloidogyne hapla]|uniref:PPM-type phosphatase domain-containing protein n=1 Tax=Meloidogyne hapla TaxID=6305 RepID=A0A1I8C215_MELHA
MGAFLDKPKTEKTNDIGVGRDYRYVVASMQGWRIDMEDAHHVKISIGKDPPFENWSFFAVFDGHAGSNVAFHSAENLLQTLLETPAFRDVKDELNSNGQKITEKSISSIKEGMRSGFLRLDASMENLPGGTEKERSGTTAICAILTPDYIFFANLGDSRGILSRKSDNIFSTEDHKPYMEKERDRIVKAGGSVMIQRVNGSLAVSRALGDYEYKSVPGLCATEQLVSPEPDIYIIERNKEDDEFLVLACDGIYDVLENEELCRLVRSRLTVTEDLKHASNQVLDVCLSKGSRDNMTMIMVVFDAAPKVKNEAVELENVWLESVDKRLKELIDSKHDGADDADSITLILKQEGFDDNSPSTCDIHLARSLIDRVLEENKLDESQQRQQSQQHQEANNISNNLLENADDSIKTATEVEAGEEIDYG